MLCHCSPCYLLYSHFILTQTFFPEKATPSFKISRTPSPFISVSYLFSLYIFSRSNSSIGRFLCILRNLPASSHLYCSAELSLPCTEHNGTFQYSHSAASCLHVFIYINSNQYMYSHIFLRTLCIFIRNISITFDILRMNVIQIHYSVI